MQSHPAVGLPEVLGWPRAPQPNGEAEGSIFSSGLSLFVPVTSDVNWTVFAPEFVVPVVLRLRHTQHFQPFGAVWLDPHRLV